MGFLDLIGGNKSKKFIESHKVPPELEPLLTVGAILTYANKHPPQVLATLPNTVQDPRDILSTMGIHNTEDFRESIEWLFEEGQRFETEEMFKRFKDGDEDALSGVQKKMYRSVLEYMDRNPLYDANRSIKKMSISFAESVDNCIAWDLERAAFWARMAANAGFISDDEAWEVLGLCYDFVKSRFSCWAEYTVSFMNGRALVMCNPEQESSMFEVFDNACLLGDLKWGAIWAMHPLD